MTECRCGRPTRDDAYVCDNHADELARALGEVPALDEELEVTITKQRGAATGEGVAASATCSCDDDDDKCQHALVPWHDAAATARRNLKALLVTWARFCEAEDVRHQSPRTKPLCQDDDSIQGLSGWLLWRVDGLALHELGMDAVDEIVSAVAHCARLIDRPAERQYVGPCACGRDLYRKPGTPVAKCAVCGAVIDAEALLSSLRAKIMGRLVTAHEGAALLSRFDLETKQGTIDKWRERGRIVERGHNPAGHRLYLFDELLTLAAQHAPREMTA